MKNNTVQTNIPNEWQATKVGALGFAYNGLKSKSKTDFGHGKPYIPYMNIFTHSRINPKQVDYVEIDKNENQNAVKYGDVFFTVSSETPEEVGISSVLLDKIDDLYLNSFCFGFRLNNFKQLLPEYARFLFRGSDFRFQIIKMAQGSTRFNLSKDRVLSLSVLLPSLTEQQKIAEILGGVDEDIAKTQEVIGATEKLKCGLMQQLFTRGIGHTKFKETKLGDVCIFQTGKLNSNKAVEGGEYPFFTCAQETFSIDQYSFDEQAVLLAGNNAAGKYSVKYYKGKFDAYQRTYVISVKNERELSYNYLREVLNTRLNELRDSSVGSTTKFLTLKLLQNLPVSLPPIETQKKIAEILSAVDEKISVNKKLKEKLTLLKKGLMQDLLSGKVRTNI